MKRILIAIDEFNELLFCETILKKVGFDTQSFQTDLAISEGILTFNPDLLVMSAAGNRVNGIAYLSKLKTKSKNLPVVLIGQRNRLNVSDRQIVALLEPPLSPRVLIEVLSNIFDLDEDQLLAKYEKSSEFKNVTDKTSQYIKSREKEETRDTEVNLVLFREKTKQSEDIVRARSERYKKAATATKLPPFLGIPRALVQDQVKYFRRDEDTPEIKKIDEERRMFAIELARKFKK